MKKIMLIAIFSFALFLNSCEDQLLSEDYKGGDWFYLGNDGAIMPVWVKGNRASNVFIVYLHGGPGGTSFDATTYAAYEQLEKDYTFVYYDQRGSYAAQGTASNKSFTMEQFMEDLQKLVILIKNKYNNPTLFLLGHSWGGAPGTAYLLDEKNQHHISGWIEIDGAHNMEEAMILSFDWAKTKAEEKINAGKDASFWKNELSWYNSAPVTWNNFVRHAQNVVKLGGDYYDNANNPGTFNFWNTPVSAFSFINALNMTFNINITMEKLNLSPEMHKIKIPSLILWGRHDAIIPVEMAQNAYDNLGTDSSDKYLHILEYSGHNPFLEEPEIFVERVREFIEKYR